MSTVEEHQRARLTQWLAEIGRRQGDGHRLPDGRLGAIYDHLIWMCNKVHLSYHKRIELFFDWARRRLDSASSSAWDKDDLLLFADALIEYGQHVLPDVDEEMRENLEDLDRFRSRPCKVGAHLPFPYPEDAALRYTTPMVRDCRYCGVPASSTPEPQVSDAGLDSQGSWTADEAEGGAPRSGATAVSASAPGNDHNGLPAPQDRGEDAAEETAGQSRMGAVVGGKNDGSSKARREVLGKVQMSAVISDDSDELKDELEDELYGLQTGGNSPDDGADGYEGSDELSDLEDTPQGGDADRDPVANGFDDANKDVNGAKELAPSHVPPPSKRPRQESPDDPLGYGRPLRRPKP
ncbi:hypothetical protein OC842_005378 [Tilletia horrida]|uniref:Uncharacterized protein n=1 Tax=Tilletia horrida TaxID=155126 RepID=A0AAN6G7V9_9BASI|nr:hypothetical protein OC842_005378 [Tilletia horrida]